MSSGAGFDLYYHTEGNGTADSPAVLTFTFTKGSLASLKDMRAPLPSSVTLDISSSGGFIMKGADPAMTRTDLSDAFYALLKSKDWIGKHQA